MFHKYYMGDKISMTPLVSIIVPVFNVEKYLKKCLDSLVEQTLKEIEIICINDCSTDESLSILQEYEKKDDRIIVVDLHKNIKQGGARNVGLRIAKASYVAFVDSDDWVDKNMYKKLYEVAEENDADIVCSDYYVYDSPNKILTCLNCKKEIFSASKDDRRKYFILNGIRLWTNIYKKKLFIDNELFFPENLLYEDNAVVLPLYLSAETVLKIDSPFYYYRRDNVSTTRSINNYRFFDRLETSITLLDNLKRLGYYSLYKEEIDFRFIELYYVNTIIVALSQFFPPEKSYINKVKASIKEICPDFENNSYYKKNISYKIRFILSLINRNTFIGILFYKLVNCLKRN